MPDTLFNPERLGIHYFPEGEHYGSQDLELWLPKLQQLGLRWITLRAPGGRAIPENFLRALHQVDIRPIIHMPLPLDAAPAMDEMRPLLKAYAQWGVHYVAFFDRPNLRASWPESGWTQRNLVERFLEFFLPPARAAAELGMSPLFPPLEPGGDYWDTAFLRRALEEMITLGEEPVLGSLALGAYGWIGDKPIRWGAGGPERWPATLPYFTPDDSEDQRGFRIFDWYNAVARATLGEEIPLIMLGAGKPIGGAHVPGPELNPIIEMGKAVCAPLNQTDEEAFPVPENVLACNFWLLAEDRDHGWYDAQGQARPVVVDWLTWKNQSADDATPKWTPANAGSLPHGTPLATPLVAD